MGLLSNNDFIGNFDIATNYSGLSVQDLKDKITKEGAGVGNFDISFSPTKTNIFSSANFSTDTVTKNWCGLVGDIEELESQYKVRITSSQLGWGIIAALQDRTSLKVSSSWEPIVPRGVVGTAARLGAVTQLATGKVLYTRWMTRRIWTGTSPIVMTMNLQFVSINNTKLNVMYPCLILQQIVLPSGGKKSEPWSFLRPPGPSPYLLDKAWFRLGEDLRKFLREQSDIVTISVGDFLQFNSVIIRDVNVTFDSRMSIDGYPISATADVVFETYEILTKESLQEAFKGRLKTIE